MKLKRPRQCPLVLLVKAGLKGDGLGKVVGNRMSEYAVDERRCECGRNFERF